MGFTTSEPIYGGSKSLKELVQFHMNALEKRLIHKALAEAMGNKSEAARRLEVDYKTLLRKIKALGIG